MFTIKEKGPALVIKCPHHLEKAHAPTVEIEIKNWLLKQVDIYIFDMKDVLQIDTEIVRIFCQLSLNLKKNNKYFMCLNPPITFRKTLKERGLEQAFCPVSSLDEAYDKASVKTPKKQAKLDTEFLNPFIKGTVETFSTQLQQNLDPQKPFVKKGVGAIDSNVDIAGVISLTCPSFTGSISICFSSDVFLKIYEIMVGEKHETINTEVQDAAGEILNIIYGQAKTELKNKGYQLEKALPTVMVGQKLQLHHGANKTVLIIPFKSAMGDFHLEVMLHTE